MDPRVQQFLAILVVGNVEHRVLRAPWICCAAQPDGLAGFIFAGNAVASPTLRSCSKTLIAKLPSAPARPLPTALVIRRHAEMLPTQRAQDGNRQRRSSWGKAKQLDKRIWRSRLARLRKAAHSRSALAAHRCQTDPQRGQSLERDVRIALLTNVWLQPQRAASIFIQASSPMPPSSYLAGWSRPSESKRTAPQATAFKYSACFCDAGSHLNCTGFGYLS